LEKSRGIHTGKKSVWLENSLNQ